MATNTTNYGWTKPDYEDAADIMVINGTIDNIDAQVKTVETALDDKADKSTTYTKTEVDTALDSKADSSDIPTVPITAIQKNGTGITPVSGTVNITVPTTAADVSALPDTTKYAAALSLTINSSTYVMTGQLKDQNGDNLGTAQTIDLPLESVVVGGSYNSQTKKVVLTLQNGNTIEFSVADLVAGLQTELSASNKLNPAYINYDSTHRAVSDTEKSTWNGKQNAIDSSHKLSADLVDDTNATNKFATAEELEQIQTNKNNISTDEASLVELVDGGAKNHINNTLTSGTTPSGNISYTVNKDKSITIKGGTATANADIVIPFSVNTSGTYVLTGGAVGGGAVTYKAQIALYPSMTNVVGLYDNTYAETALSTGTDYAFRFRVYPGQTVPDCTIYPMICTKAAWDISHEYQPYRPSYQELYERIVTLEQANQ